MSTYQDARVQKNIDELEALLDQHGAHDMIDILGDIAAEKADHLRSNWQDETAGREWDKLATKLHKIAAQSTPT